MKALKGKIALVPGGTGGIGAPICRALAAEGAKVIVAGRDGAKAKSLSQQLKGFSATLDVRDVASIEAALKPWKRIDILVNCVGLQREQKLGEVTEEAFDALLAQIPVGRFCEPEEFAHVVRFLVSPLAGFITGEIVDLNGGLVMD